MLNHITMFQPSAIDNALSTMQILHKLINEINGIIDVLNDIDSKANKYTDEQITKLDNKLSAEINLQVTNLNKKIKELNIYANQLEVMINDVDKNCKKYTDEQINILNNNIQETISKIYDDLYDLKIEMKKYSDTLYKEVLIKIDDLRKEIYEVLEKWGGAKIYSPVTGMFKTVKEVLDEFMYIYLKRHSITYDKLCNICNIGNIQKQSLTVYPTDSELYYKQTNDFVVIEALSDLIYVRPIGASNVTNVYFDYGDGGREITDECTIINDSVKIPFDDLKVEYYNYVQGYGNVIHITIQTETRICTIDFYTYYDGYVCTYENILIHSLNEEYNVKVTYEDINVFGINALNIIIYTDYNISLINLNEYIHLVSDYYDSSTGTPLPE